MVHKFPFFVLFKFKQITNLAGCQDRTIFSSSTDITGFTGTVRMDNLSSLRDQNKL